MLQLDEEVEGMESTICALQQQLKDTKRNYQNSQDEVSRLKTKLETLTALDQEQKTDVSRNDLVPKQPKNLFQTIESHNKETLRDLGTNCDANEDNNDTGLRTKFHSDEESNPTHKTPNKASTKNPFSISQLLSPDSEKVKPQLQWMVTDDGGLGHDVGKTEEYHGKPGTNGQYVDSDSNMSS